MLHLKSIWGIAPTLCSILLVMAGCAQPVNVWESQPTSRVLERPPFLITISPQKENSSAYNHFFLDLENKSHQPIAVD